MKPNTVMGMPEPQFRDLWVSLLWRAMAKTGKGYPYSTLKNRPPKGASRWRGERRKDKVGMYASKLARSLMLRVQVA